MFGSDGFAMRASYDELGRLVRHVDRAGAVTTYLYDPQGRHHEIVARTDPDGLTEHHAYDELVRLVRTVDRAGTVTSYRYDDTNRTPTATITEPGPVGARLGTERIDGVDGPASVTGPNPIDAPASVNGP